MPGMLPAWAANAALVGLVAFMIAAYLMNRQSRFFDRAVRTADFAPAVVTGSGVVLVAAADRFPDLVGAGTGRLWTMIGAVAVVGGVVLWAMGD